MQTYINNFELSGCRCGAIYKKTDIMCILCQQPLQKYVYCYICGKTYQTSQYREFHKHITSGHYYTHIPSSEFPALVQKYIKEQQQNNQNIHTSNIINSTQPLLFPNENVGTPNISSNLQFSTQSNSSQPLLRPDQNASPPNLQFSSESESQTLSNQSRLPILNFTENDLNEIMEQTGICLVNEIEDTPIGINNTQRNEGSKKRTARKKIKSKNINSEETLTSEKQPSTTQTIQGKQQKRLYRDRSPLWQAKNKGEKFVRKMKEKFENKINGFKVSVTLEEENSNDGTVLKVQIS